MIDKILDEARRIAESLEHPETTPKVVEALRAESTKDVNLVAALLVIAKDLDRGR